MTEDEFTWWLTAVVDAQGRCMDDGEAWVFFRLWMEAIQNAYWDLFCGESI